MKKIVLSLTIVAIATIAVLSINFSSKNNNGELSLLSLANVEALATSENSGSQSCETSISYKPKAKTMYCGTCASEDNSIASTASKLGTCSK